MKIIVRRLPWLCACSLNNRAQAVIKETSRKKRKVEKLPSHSSHTHNTSHLAHTVLAVHCVALRTHEQMQRKRSATTYNDTASQVGSAKKRISVSGSMSKLYCGDLIVFIRYSHAESATSHNLIAVCKLIINLVCLRISHFKRPGRKFLPSQKA